jgi:cytidylate kinase
MEHIVIAIDGYSSTGKSTLAKALAKELSLIYVDTGAMYRAVTLFALRHQLIGPDFFKKEALVEQLPLIKVEFKYNTQTKTGEVFLNDENIERSIRTLEVSNYVSPVAAIPEVRRKLVEQQQRLGTNGGLVMDGRDIGTVVFPNADVKFFMTASAEVRAQRRFKELIDRGETITYDEVLHNVVTRDRIDSTRVDSPLRKAADAIEFDNSNMSIKQQLEKMLSVIKKSKL